jgi:hypothetical protein
LFFQVVDSKFSTTIETGESNSSEMLLPTGLYNTVQNMDIYWLNIDHFLVPSYQTNNTHIQQTLPQNTMTDYQELLETIYGNVHKLFGLIKDHEQDLNIIDKANSLMEDTKNELLYLNDCIHRYVSDVQHPDQIANSSSSEINKPPNASAVAPESGTKNEKQQGYKQPTVTDGSDDDETL